MYAYSPITFVSRLLIFTSNGDAKKSAPAETATRSPPKSLRSYSAPSARLPLNDMEDKLETPMMEPGGGTGPGATSRDGVTVAPITRPISLFSCFSCAPAVPASNPRNPIASEVATQIVLVTFWPLSHSPRHKTAKSSSLNGISPLQQRVQNWGAKVRFTKAQKVSGRESKEK